MTMSARHQTTEDRRGTRTALDPDAGAQGLKLLRDLEGQLPGGGEDQGVEPLRGGQQRLEDGQSEGARLPRARLRQANHVLPLAPTGPVRNVNSSCKQR